MKVQEEEKMKGGRNIVWPKEKKCASEKINIKRGKVKINLFRLLNNDVRSQKHLRLEPTQWRIT